MICDCKPAQLDAEGQVLIVGTCPVCLPPGAISWLIENGRQLDMFSDAQTAPLARRAPVPQVDSSLSVSDSRMRTSLMLNDYMTQGLCSCDLPF